jgi:hypothetical protein
VLLGLGDGRFAAQQRFGTGDSPLSVAVGDLDGDGAQDLAVANGGSNGDLDDDVSILINQRNADDDGDGIGDDEDVCPDTVIPEPVPTHHLGVNRWALVNEDDIFDTTPPPGGGNGPGYEFTLEDTAGCSCEQIIDELHLGQGHVKFGCSTGAMLQWMQTVSDEDPGGGGNDTNSIFERNWRLPANGTVHIEPGR